MNAAEKKRARNKEWMRNYYATSNLKSKQRPGYKEKRRATAWRGHLKRTYGLTFERYQEMAANGCHICGAPDRPEKRLHVDHDHSTLEVRGLLCDPCNRGIGCFSDNPERLRRAIEYLKGA